MHIVDEKDEQPLVHTVAGTSVALGNSVSMVWKLIASDQLQITRIGARTYVFDDSIRELLEKGRGRKEQLGRVKNMTDESHRRRRAAEAAD